MKIYKDLHYMYMIFHFHIFDFFFDLLVYITQKDTGRLYIVTLSHNCLKKQTEKNHFI